VATSEPVVLHHGREGGGGEHDDVRPSASTACWAASLSVRLELYEVPLARPAGGLFREASCALGRRRAGRR